MIDFLRLFGLAGVTLQKIPNCQSSSTKTTLLLLDHLKKPCGLLEIKLPPALWHKLQKFQLCLGLAQVNIFALFTTKILKLFFFYRADCSVYWKENKNIN
jgi:hypothetical protein